MTIPNRRPCVTTDIGSGLAVTVSFHPKTGDAVEVFMTKRGNKAGQSELDDAMYKLGVTASKLMQEGFKDEPGKVAS
jgi:hypothetical protein